MSGNEFVKQVWLVFSSSLQIRFVSANLKAGEAGSFDLDATMCGRMHVYEG